MKRENRVYDLRLSAVKLGEVVTVTPAIPEYPLITGVLTQADGLGLLVETPSAVLGINWAWIFSLRKATPIEADVFRENKQHLERTRNRTGKGGES